jgi:Polysaccharide pyruvyl transferase
MKKSERLVARPRGWLAMASVVCPPVLVQLTHAGPIGHILPRAMYLILTGAKKNLGDALIVERCMALLRHLKPQHELHEVRSWEPLDPDRVKTAAALIIPGGPGYRPKLYPNVYPLMPSPQVYELPLYIVGGGWKGIPGDRTSIETYKFSKETLQLLRSMSERKALSTRDYATSEILAAHGIRNSLMTGCCVWYDLDSLGQAVRAPREVKTLVYTPAQVSEFGQQSVEVARALAELFPRATKICSFHRGVGKADSTVPESDAKNNGIIEQAVRALGYEVADVSIGNQSMAFYDSADLHVGYRVHAHLHFLSKRLPSLLIHEDGRGIGTSESIGLRGIDGFVRAGAGSLAAQLEIPTPLGKAMLRKLTHGLRLKEYSAAPSVANAVQSQLEQDLLSEFSRFAGVGPRIDAHFAVMKRFLSQLPD